MKKRRSTVLVSPGKDVTLYIPTDTPPEVIAYMNQLKTEGMFSQGIMDILIKHILQERSLATFDSEDELHHAITSFKDEEQPFTAPMEDQTPSDVSVANSQKSFSLEDIFRQASRNAGKLM